MKEDFRISLKCADEVKGVEREGREVPIRDFSPAVTVQDLDTALALLRRQYAEETQYPGSAVTPELVSLNLDHVARVRANAAVIAGEERLDSGLLELAALLHDVCKLNHRETSGGGVDTWHHHHLGASVARKMVLTDLKLGAQVADAVGRMIEAHSDIPFIRRYWEAVYGSGLPTPATPEEFALRDADVIDLLWVGGIYKIVHIRQVPGSMFYEEDGGDIRKAIVSARGSFLESVSVLSTTAGRHMAEGRILTMEAFFDRILEVRSLQEFDEANDEFLAERARNSDAIQAGRTLLGDSRPATNSSVPG
jgi:putative nucleotidyltransferase with HDIG domain